MDRLNVDMGGPGGSMGGYFIWAGEVQYGVTYSDPEDQPVALARILDVAEKILGRPLVVGTVNHIASNIEDGERDMFGDPVVTKAKRKHRRRTQARGTADLESWY